MGLQVQPKLKAPVKLLFPALLLWAVLDQADQQPAVAAPSPRGASGGALSAHLRWACVVEGGSAWEVEVEAEEACSCLTEVSLTFIPKFAFSSRSVPAPPPTIPVRPASPLPPGVPTGPRNQNRYKDRDGNAPAVDGLDYGGTQGASLETDDRGNSRYGA